jgi:transposase
VFWLTNGLRPAFCLPARCGSREVCAAGSCIALLARRFLSSEEETVSDDVMIAVDPHKASNTAAVLDPVTKTVIESARFANSQEGYVRLTGFAARWGQRQWAVEGCHGAGRSLAQRLVADGEQVLDVPAKLAARVRVYSCGHGRKTDKDDAVSIGLAALDGTGVLPVTCDGALVSLRLLCDRRDELTAQRTQAVCRLHRLLAELTPGGMRRELTANKAQALLARIRPADEVGGVRVHIARDHLADIRALDARLKFIAGQIAALVTASGTTLTSLFGVGPVIAGRILAETGEVARFATRDKFASYNGTAPIDASSGEQARHRLSRAGNRRINHALHMMAVTQIRYPGTVGRLYYEQKRREGKTPKEALRCLKRRLSDVVYRQLVLDQRGTIESCGSPTPPPPTPSTSTSPARRSRPAAPLSRLARPRAWTGSSRWTGRTTGSSAWKSSTPAAACPPTSSTKPRSSADRGRSTR